MLVLITGTDTGVGKTVATCAILESAGTGSIPVHSLKPIETGYLDIRDDRSDSTAILNVLNKQRRQRKEPEIAIDRVNLHSFYSPVAPQVAAPHEGKEISWDRLLKFITDVDTPNNLVFVEGSGGPLVPICNGRSYADLATELKMTTVVVVGSKLGCLNHTLLTIEVLQQRKIPIAGYVFNELGATESKESSTMMVSRETNRSLLKELLTPAGVSEIGYIPYLQSRSDMGGITIQPFWKGLLACG